MGVILGLIQLIVGIVLLIFTVNEVLLPLLYGLPRVLSLTLRRYLKWRTPVFYLLRPIFWMLLIVIMISGLATLAPEFTLYLMGSVGFRVGLTVGFILPIAKLFLFESARFQVDVQLCNSIRGYATRKGVSSLVMIIHGG